MTNFLLALILWVLVAIVCALIKIERAMKDQQLSDDTQDRREKV